jgi:hypothetical protein
MNTEAQGNYVESESDRIMREQASLLKKNKKQPKVLKEPSGVFDSADR